MSTHGKPDVIGGLLTEFFARRNWEQRLGMHAVFQFWNEAVGDEIAAQAQPEVFRGEVLWVKAADSVWMQQLHLQKNLLLAELNRRLPAGRIADLRFRLSAGPLAGPPAPGKAPAAVRSPGAEERRNIEKVLLPLKDEELKGIMLRLWTKSRSR